MKKKALIRATGAREARQLSTVGNRQSGLFYLDLELGPGRLEKLGASRKNENNNPHAPS